MWEFGIGLKSSIRQIALGHSPYMIIAVETPNFSL